MIFNGYTPMGEYEFSKEILELMHKNATKTTYPKNKIILYPGDEPGDIYYIDEGKVILGLWNEQGEERIIEILGANNFFAMPSVLSGIPDRIYAVTEEASIIYKLKKDDCERLLDESKIFRDIIMRYISTMVIKLIVLIEGITFNQVKDRIYNLLWVSRNIDHIIDEKWYTLRCKYSQKDIARIVGANRSTISRLIGELCDEGAIRIINKTIQITAIKR